MIRCPRCGELRDDVKGYCRPCRREYIRVWRAANPDKVARYKAREEAGLYKDRRQEERDAEPWRNEERICEWCEEPYKPRSSRTRYCTDSHSAKGSYFLRHYGITRSHLTVLLERQGGVCGICRKPMTGPHNLNVDHDHDTGRVRGLLCGQCNRSLGGLGDNLEKLRRAIRYLEKTEVEGVFPQSMPQE